MEFYKLRPFGFVRESHLFGTIVAQQYNINKIRGRDRGWHDFFPVNIRRGKDGRDSDQRIIEIFKEYNRERGYPEKGK